jgi:hypothetical protein
MQRKTKKVIFSLLFLATLASLIAINAAWADDGTSPLTDTQAADAPQPLTVSAFCNVTILNGETWYFFADASGGVGTVTFQWYQGTAMIAGQNSMLFAATPTAPGTYTYTCQVTDDSGTTITSNAVVLTVI